MDRQIQRVLKVLRRFLSLLRWRRVVIVAREFDECNNCSYDDQKARLDNLAVELQNDPTTRAYIIAYGGRMSPLGQVEKLMSRARDYLVAQRGIDASRFTLSTVDSARKIASNSGSFRVARQRLARHPPCRRVM